MLEQRLEQDIKSALLAGDKFRATVLRGLKAALLNVKVASGKRESGLSDDEVIAVFAKEAKKRQESADLYLSGGDSTRSDSELQEKSIIETYLPPALSEGEITEVIDDVIKELNATDSSKLGQVIGQVKLKLGAAANGSVIAKLTKEKLQ